MLIGQNDVMHICCQPQIAFRHGVQINRFAFFVEPAIPQHDRMLRCFTLLTAVGTYDHNSENDDKEDIDVITKNRHPTVVGIVLRG